MPITFEQARSFSDGDEVLIKLIDSPRVQPDSRGRAYRLVFKSFRPSIDHRGPPDPDKIAHWMIECVISDDLIDRWHNGAGEGQELHDWLGLSFQDYGRWVDHPGLRFMLHCWLIDSIEKVDREQVAV